MKYFDWDIKKNEKLRETRNISFEQIVFAIANDKLLNTLEHPNSEKYPNQKLFVVEISDYAYVVPFIEDEEKYFPKTIYPSREATKRYLKNE